MVYPRTMKMNLHSIFFGKHTRVIILQRGRGSVGLGTLAARLAVSVRPPRRFFSQVWICRGSDMSCAGGSREVGCDLHDRIRGQVKERDILEGGRR